MVQVDIEMKSRKFELKLKKRREDYIYYYEVPKEALDSELNDDPATKYSVDPHLKWRKDEAEIYHLGLIGPQTW